jgi:ketosteroid isomerase-like protein
MKLTLLLISTLVLFAMTAIAQTDLQKMVDTEHEFARFAADKGTKSAFLAFITPDGLLFQPDKVNGIAYWNGRGESAGLLSWAPNYADMSANGIMGYTTGNWEYRAKGKDDEPGAFGEFITIWLRQPDGKYKFVVDIGIGHDRPAKYSTDWVTTSERSSDLNLKNSSAADSANGFYTMMASGGPVKAYKAYAIDDVRAFREEKQPFIGKKALLSALKDDKATYALAKRSTFFGSADIAYNLNTYTRSLKGKIVEKGNTLQIWKLVNGRWRIVLDVLKPVPEKT